MKSSDLRMTAILLLAAVLASATGCGDSVFHNREPLGAVTQSLGVPDLAGTWIPVETDKIGRASCRERV